MNTSKRICFGVICPPLMGHLYPMLSLAVEMQRRGHRVVLFYYFTSKYLAKINQLGIEMISVCNEENRQLLLNELETLEDV